MFVGDEGRKTLIIGTAVIGGLIGWALWERYQTLKEEVAYANREVASLRAEAMDNQELLGAAIVAEQRAKNLQAELDSVRGEVSQVITNLPENQRILLPGGVVEEIKQGNKVPWIWIISGIGMLVLAGVVLKKKSKRKYKQVLSA